VKCRRGIFSNPASRAVRIGETCRRSGVFRAIDRGLDDTDDLDLLTPVERFGNTEFRFRAS
jgi:hypothetical protein